MHRRRFIKVMLNIVKTTVLMGVLPAPAVLAASIDERDEKLHYSLLNGRTLREIAARKMHHGHNGRFLNPFGERHRKRRFGSLLYWKLFSKNKYEAYLDEQPVNPVRIDWQPVQNYRGLSITFVKHACILIKDMDRYFIVDPVFSGIFPFIRDFSPIAFDPNDMPGIDHILVTHGHYDHLDKASLAVFSKNTHVLSPLGYEDIFKDLRMRNHTRLDWYDSYRDGKRQITLLPCNHWTMRNPFIGPNRSLWGSYLIQTSGGQTIYISGDTAYFDGFHEIGRQFDIDLAVFNLGAYEPRWFMATSHLNPRETVQAFKELRAEKLMIVHWGTFQLGDDPVHFPPLDLQKELEKEGLLDRWVQIRHGETYFA